MEEEEREKCGIVTINRPIDRPRPPANPSATVFINNVCLSYMYIYMYIIIMMDCNMINTFNSRLNLIIMFTSGHINEEVFLSHFNVYMYMYEHTCTCINIHV